MRLFSIAVIALLTLSFASNLRADYALWTVTPENIEKVGNLKVEAKADPSGVVRFVVRRESESTEPTEPTESDKSWQRYLSGLLRLKVAENVWTEAPVVPDARPGATEYRFAVAPAHLDIATFNVIRTEGLGGEWYEIPLKAFAPKAEGQATESSESTRQNGTDATKKEKVEAPKTDKEGT